jgi:hypothetical protein
MPLSEGARFAGYTVVRLLGAGGMGEVYLVRHPRLPRFEALKILRADLSADPDYQQRFNREADLAGALWHPHIVGVHDRGEFEGQLWITMDYVNGPDVGALLRQHYPTGMPPAQVIDIMTAVGAALDHAHHRGLLHRDVKPANIMVSHPDDGGTPRIMLSDFGIARPVDDTTGLTVTNMTVGTVDYCSPEQLLGHQLDPRADQYSLAATAYHLLTGTKPFANPSPVAVISAHLTQRPPLPGTIRPHLAGTDPVFARALAKTPTDRYPRCTDFATALANQLLTPTTISAPHDPMLRAPAPVAGFAPPAPTGHPVGPAPAPPPLAPPPWAAAAPPRRGRKRLVVAALSALAVLAVLAGVGTVTANKLIAHNASKHAAQDREAARLAGQHYLEALAVGDARAALALGAQQPPTPQLLTDKVLRAQLATTPVTDIVVTNDSTQDQGAAADAQRLVMAANFGTTPSKTVLWAHKKDGQWKLDVTTIEVTIDKPANADEAMKTVAIYGVGTNGANPVSVFPGTPAVSSTNRYIDITAATKPLLLESLTDTNNRSSIQPTVALNDAGRQASLTAVDTKIHSCFTGVAPPQGCCPPGGCQFTGGPGTDYDTLKIDKIESTQDMNYELDPNVMKVHVTGTINYSAQVQVNSQPKTLRDAMRVDSFVDLTKDPPVYAGRTH